MDRLEVLTSHLPAGATRTRCVSAAPPQQRQMLSGIRVVELATVIAGPACAAVMADFGADVVKVERPGGDSWRGDRATKTPDDPWGGPHFAQNNRGKRSVVLDLKQPGHLQALRRLIRTADVFVTNVRYPALKRMGLDYESLKAEHPRLIFAILTAWGLQGERSGDPGYDVGAFWAASGLQDFTKPTNDGHVGQFPPGIGDHMTSLQLLSGVALALWHRDKTGCGKMVEASLLRSGIWGMAYPLLNTALNPGGKFIREPRTQHYRPTFNVYKCSDDTWLQLLGLDLGRFDAKICAALGISPEDIAGKPGPAVIALFDAKFGTKPSTYWEPRLKENGVWYQRAVGLGEVLADPQAHAVGAYAKVEGVSFPLIACPVQISGESHMPTLRPPVCGEHTVEVLASLGYSKDAADGIHTATKKWQRGAGSD
ncbi:E-cinnamoyl-CoA:R-phenyllactate CoA transferase [Diplonema papillatum]|nr:E-cinnamoyl-CoA:R-phenyllactate CoA transferase [Diplonema papillatum]